MAASGGTWVRSCYINYKPTSANSATVSFCNSIIKEVQIYQLILFVVCRLLIKKQKQNTKNGNHPPSIRGKFKFILTKITINLQIKRNLKQ